MNYNITKGFTAMELVVAIGIISILASIALLSYHSINQNVFLDTSTKEIADTLRVAQNRAISSQDNKPWGVHFGDQSDQYLLFSGEWGPNSTTDAEYNLKNGIAIISVTGTREDGTQEVITELNFQKLSGLTEDAEIIVGFPGGKQKTISVASGGKISL
ncbi:MAG: hypothetical protein COT24_02690 [Candidatus Kerfeldbacteria bacterium CG08_land_8_20_14_0_20_40_16]|uniref:General secretion pathway GspH domain-containing protein n=1 Tax=Candidatus Kerfeldbacteria bacterium CG08_land_8_20_14_0_20_40_16 TaxID=2014244 RepID=A0A2H0YWE6_9BACT|nr:MAG: hypothetical protein COT24_02690 [Candidatus Kerfeldbacteria bacterium CG08_land_8_20_14_0_20_40_16]